MEITHRSFQQLNSLLIHCTIELHLLYFSYILEMINLHHKACSKRMLQLYHLGHNLQHAQSQQAHI